MTREEAAKILYQEKSNAGWMRWVGFPVDIKKEQDYKRFILAVDVALDALLGPQPAPDTGLVPCGCGCEPELRDDGRGWYQVCCTGCDMHGGNSHTPDGVIEEWNTAMGWRVEG
jgi:hypothetical protein